MATIYYFLSVDTFLQFFRAYYDPRGYLIYNLRKIRRNYIRSGWFFFNLLSSIPTSLLIWSGSFIPDQMENSSQWDTFLMVLDVFKLLRLFRLKRLMSTSSLADSYSERMNVMVTSEFICLGLFLIKWDLSSQCVILCSRFEIYDHDNFVIGE